MCPGPEIEDMSEYVRTGCDREFENSDFTNKFATFFYDLSCLRQ